jgi:hypothetical protein
MTETEIQDLAYAATERQEYDVAISLKWLGLFGQVNLFYKWVTACVMPQPGLVGAV